MSIFISYMILGLSLSAPVGPVNAAQLDKGIKKGFWHAWLFGIGAVLADILYMVLVYLGVVHFLNTPFMQTFLWLFGAFVLIYSGLESILNANKVTISQASNEDTLWKSMLSGFLMSVSNPMTILFWLGIYGSILVKTAADNGSGQLFLYSVAVITGVVVWDLFMAALGSIFRRYLSNKALSLISILSGFSLIVFGVYFGIRAITLLYPLLY
ncbi:amino acid transporter [Bacillus sp. FJAT-18019]|uniref:Amino acid transporter n=1 Tax=Paenibacillus solani TaxID=1705565 RepID=A0A0M1P660_9BACL|nr:LysE family transporter [Paenibacillus solani]KOP67763.1 amino acid transporter [Bacillus sp. FJAT-18019]KOR89882.1 amino acid transporter [Paenibacillus solani]